MSNPLAKGLYVKAPHERAPDFVLYDISIKCDDFFDFMAEHKNDKGYINLQILRSRDNKPYAVLNEYRKPDADNQDNQDNENSSFKGNVQKEEKKAPFEMFKPAESDEDIPF